MVPGEAAEKEKHKRHMMKGKNIQKAYIMEIRRNKNCLRSYFGQGKEMQKKAAQMDERGRVSEREK